MGDILDDLYELMKQSVYDTPTIHAALEEIERLRSMIADRECEIDYLNSKIKVASAALSE